MSEKQNLSFPEGDALGAQVATRNRRGVLFQTLFMAATIVAIIALLALLYNIINSAFGLVAVQNRIAPQALVIGLNQDRMLAAPNTVSSEDDNDLAAGIAADPNAVGFFGYAYYLDNQATLRALSIDGVTPSAESVDAGEYPLERPLYIYTTADLLAQKPQVAAFVNYYVNNVNNIIDEVGYFAVGAERIDISAAAIAEALDGQPAPSPADVEGAVLVTGSSTVYPVSQRIAADFVAAGFAGDVAVENVGSTAGLRAFCIDRSVDIAGSSRPITAAEREACRANGRAPLEFRVANDALAVVVNRDNNFADNLSRAQLVALFTTAQSWDAVDANWPAEPVARYIPGIDSGTLDFFAEEVFALELRDLPKADLVELLVANISLGRGRVLEREQRFFADRLVFESPELFAEVCAADAPPAGCTADERSAQNVYTLLLDEVVEPRVLNSWSLVDSTFNRSAVLAEAAQRYPDAEVEFRAWFNPTFVTSPQSPEPELAGVRTAIIGSLWVILITILFSFPVGVGAAIYLEEYAAQNRFNKIVQTNINNLAGVPSIIYGLLGVAVFVRILDPLTSGRVFGATADNGRTVLAAGLTLGLLILPIIIINSQEAIRAVPNSLRQASYAMGATRWQTIWHHVLPNALPGILTGTILAMSRAIGETAPLVVVGASTFITVDPNGPFAKFTVLPIQVYQWTSRPQAAFQNIAAAAIITLLIMLLTLNASAVILRNRFSKKFA